MNYSFVITDLKNFTEMQGNGSKFYLLNYEESVTRINLKNYYLNVEFVLKISLPDCPGFSPGFLAS